jgi:hypothetical protein
VMNSTPALAADCWLVDVVPNANSNGDLRVVLAGDPTGVVNMDIAWLVKSVPVPP